jgi:hypothetical protein
MMMRVVRAVVQVLRAECAAYTPALKRSDRMLLRIRPTVTMTEVAEVEDDLQRTLRKCAPLGVTYKELLEEERQPQEELTWRVNHLCYPLWPGRAVLIATPLFVSLATGFSIPMCGLLVVEGIAAGVVVLFQSCDRMDEFAKYAKRKCALDKLAALHAKAAEKKD